MKCVITTPSRLHFSLIDLNGELGRVDGGIGVALNEPSLKIEVSVVDESEGVEEKENPKEVVPVLKKISRGTESELKLKGKYSVNILKRLPAHVGLGSQTQLALSIAKAIMVLENKDKEYSVRELARIVGRGGTSGIGVAAFEKGGFILDGGHVFQKGKKEESVKSDFLPSSASNATPSPIIFQHPLPEDWFFVVAIPDVKKGAHGAEEVEIFRRLCPIRRGEVEKVCRVVLMQVLPAVLEKDLKSFAKSLTSLQYMGFKKKEVELQHAIIKELFSFFESHALGYGMSSFGPTTYAIVEGEKRAKELANSTNDFFSKRHIQAFVSYSNANNKGSEVRCARI